MSNSRAFGIIAFLACLILPDGLNAASPIIDFLNDDMSFQTYETLNLISSAQDLSGNSWQLTNSSGIATKSVQTLTLGTYPDNLYQLVNLNTGETYIFTLTAAASNGDVIWINIRNANTNSQVSYEYLSLRDEVDTYPIRFSVPSTDTYAIEVRLLPGYVNVTLDWGMLGLFKESELLAAGAKWSKYSVWADSMGGANNRGAWPRRLKAFLDTPDYIDGAVGGQTSSQILSRMLAATDYGELAFIWAGNNNPDLVDTVLSDIDQMVSRLPHKNFIVISVHNNALFDSSTLNYAHVIEINTHLEKTYGNRFIDTRSYLIANADLSDPNDLADASAGIVPRSFRIDDIHLNTKGQDYVTQLLVDRITSLSDPSSSNDSNGSGGGCTIHTSATGDAAWLFMIIIIAMRHVRSRKYRS